jgi:hypothetical protein
MDSMNFSMTRRRESMSNTTLRSLSSYSYWRLARPIAIRPNSLVGCRSEFVST